MSWDAIGAVAELLGAVGVIASLFYLGAQVRQNTKSLRASSYHAVVTNLSNLSGSIGLSPPGSDLFIRGLSDFSTLDPHEQRQCTLLLVSLFRNYEDIFYQFDQGMVDESVWGGWEHSMTRVF